MLIRNLWGITGLFMEMDGSAINYRYYLSELSVKCIFYLQPEVKYSSFHCYADQTFTQSDSRKLS